MVPAMGPNQATDRCNVRFCIAIRILRLAGGREDGLAAGVTSQPGRDEDLNQLAVTAEFRALLVLGVVGLSVRE